MDDAAFVRRFQGLGDLPRDGQCFVERDRTLGNTIREGGTIDKFENERVAALDLFEAVDGGDVRVIQRCQDLRFPFEP